MAREYSCCTTRKTYFREVFPIVCFNPSSLVQSVTDHQRADLTRVSFFLSFFKDQHKLGALIAALIFAIGVLLGFVIYEIINRYLRGSADAREERGPADCLPYPVQETGQPEGHRRPPRYFLSSVSSRCRQKTIY